MQTQIPHAARPPEIAALTSAKPDIDRIVFALRPESKRHIFPQFDASALHPAECHWIDVSSIGAEQWEDSLFELEPTVLMTSWGTPAIPERYARSPDLSLRYICHLAGGVKPMVPRSLIERGVLVSNWGTAISHTIAEHAILLVLGTLRSLSAWSPFMRRWPGNTESFVNGVLGTRSLKARHVGIHGFGAIARELVRMLYAFGADCAAYSHGVPKDLFEKHRVRQCHSLEELFSTSDVIIECEALTPRSLGSVTESVLRLLPEDSVFVNVGSGRVVDNRALTRLACEGRLRVGLDVYEEEPLPADSVLNSLPNVLLSPHIAGPTYDAFPILFDFAMENLRRYLAGGQIEGAVTLDVYDRTT